MTNDPLDTAWITSPNAAASKVADETVLLHLVSGTYFGLNPLGSRIWQGLQAGTMPRALCATIAEERGVAVETVKADVRAFLAEMRKHDLIEQG